MSTRSLRLPIFFSVAMLLALAAPSSAAPAIAITVDAHGTLAEKDAKRLAQVDAAKEVKAQLTAALGKAGAAGMTVRIEIDEFRLRSQKQIAWSGLASGGDYIGAQVTITPDGGAPNTRKAKGVLVTGSVAGKEPKRLAKIVEGMVKEILSGL